jgi:hypothetical protein
MYICMPALLAAHISNSRLWLGALLSTWTACGAPRATVQTTVQQMSHILLFVLCCVSWPVCCCCCQAEAAAAAAKVQLPADMAQTAKSFGVRSTALSKYISLQVRGCASGRQCCASHKHRHRASRACRDLLPLKYQEAVEQLQRLPHTCFA